MPGPGALQPNSHNTRYWPHGVQFAPPSEQRGLGGGGGRSDRTKQDDQGNRPRTGNRPSHDRRGHSREQEQQLSPVSPAFYAHPGPQRGFMPDSPALSALPVGGFIPIPEIYFPGPNYSFGQQQQRFGLSPTLGPQGSPQMAAMQSPYQTSQAVFSHHSPQGPVFYHANMMMAPDGMPMMPLPPQLQHHDMYPTPKVRTASFSPSSSSSSSSSSFFFFASFTNFSCMWLRRGRGGSISDCCYYFTLLAMSSLLPGGLFEFIAIFFTPFTNASYIS
eukprot:gb/GEZN01006417.1/.p2 GENE.gb/GEZN01006417.1/~~gb/GEZN01006417.1/.p2  ORF type:complete len:284 (-),score=50.71 gb/GEZN01006417.1/:813-1637(-)